MKVRTWAIFILLINLSRLQAQSVIINAQAGEARNAGNLQEACKLLRSDLQRDSLQYETNYFLACDYALLEMKDSALHYLEAAVAIRKSFDVLTNPDLICLINDVRWRKVRRKIADAYFKQSPQYDRETTLLLAQMRMFHGAYDWEIHQQEAHGSKNALLVMHYHHMKDSLNGITKQQLERIIATKGWPKSSGVGPLGVETAFLVLQQADDKGPIQTGNSGAPSGVEADHPLYSDTTRLHHFVRVGLIPYQLLSRSSGLYLEFPLHATFSLEGRLAYTYCQPELESKYQYSLLVRGYFLYTGENAYLGWCARPGGRLKVSMLLAQRYWEYHNQWLPEAGISIPGPYVYEECKSSYLFGVGLGVGFAIDLAKKSSFLDAECFMNAFIVQCWIRDLYSAAEGSTAPPQPPLSYAYYPKEVSHVTRQPVLAIGIKLGYKKQIKYK